MRRAGLEAEGLEILCWGSVAKGLVGPVVVEAVGEGVDEGLQLVDAVRQVVGGVEFVSPCRLGALDASVEVGSFGGQDAEFEAARLAFGFEDCPGSADSATEEPW
jgi:hypothetical protein